MGIITLAIKHGDTVQEDVFQFTDDQIKAFAAELVADQVAEIARLKKELEEARKDALDDAASVCEAGYKHFKHLGDCAKEIRALKDGE